MIRTVPVRPCSCWRVSLSTQYLSSMMLLTCRCCNLDVSASEASQQLEGLLRKATTREAEQQHRQQGSVLHIPNTPPSE